MIQPHNNPTCETCGDELKKGEHIHDIDGNLLSRGVCSHCQQLENNRRYRQYMTIGEYSPTQA